MLCAGLILHHSRHQRDCRNCWRKYFSFTWTFLFVWGGHDGKVMPCRDPPAAHHAPGIALICSCTTSLLGKQPSNQPCKSSTWLHGPDFKTFQIKIGMLWIAKGCLSSDEQGLVISQELVPPAASDNLIHSMSNIHLVVGFCSVLGASCCRQNKNTGNHPSRSQSYLFFLISSHIRLQRWVFNIVRCCFQCCINYRSGLLAHFTPNTVDFPPTFKTWLIHVARYIGLGSG